MKHYCECGFGTHNHRKYKRHIEECKHGQTEQGNSEGQAVETQQDEGIKAEEMTRNELIALLEREGHTGVRRLNKPELVNLVGGD